MRKHASSLSPLAMLLDVTQGRKLPLSPLNLFLVLLTFPHSGTKATILPISPACRKDKDPPKGFSAVRGWDPLCSPLPALPLLPVYPVQG